MSSFLEPPDRSVRAPSRSPATSLTGCALLGCPPIRMLRPSPWQLASFPRRRRSFQAGRMGLIALWSLPRCGRPIWCCWPSLERPACDPLWRLSKLEKTSRSRARKSWLWPARSSWRRRAGRVCVCCLWIASTARFFNASREGMPPA